MQLKVLKRYAGFWHRQKGNYNSKAHNQRPINLIKKKQQQQKNKSRFD